MTIISVDHKLDVHFYVDKKVDVVCIQFVVDTGDMYENKQTLGMSHLLEHLLFESSPTYGDTLVDELNKRGITYNAETATNYVKYYFYGRSRYAMFMLHIVLEFFDTQKITRKQFEKERDIVLEELKGIQDDPMHKLEEESMKCIYPNTILTSTIGDIIKNTEKSTSGIVEKLHAQEYKLHKTCIVVCGNVNKNKIIDKVYQHIHHKPLQKYTLPEIYVQHKFPVRKHIHNTQVQKTYCILHFLTENRPSNYLMDMVCNYLQKRLFDFLRKKSLLYGINVDNINTPYYSMINISFNTNPEHFKKALTIVFREIKKSKIQKKIYTMVQKDIEMKMSELKGQTNVMELSNYYSDLIIYDKKIITPYQYYKKMLNISITQVEHYLQKHMNNMILITMGKENINI